MNVGFTQSSGSGAHRFPHFPPSISRAPAAGRKSRRNPDLGRWLADLNPALRTPALPIEPLMRLRPGGRFVGILNPMDQGGLIAPFRNGRAVYHSRAWSRMVRCSALSHRSFAAELVTAAWLPSWKSPCTGPVPIRGRPSCGAGAVLPRDLSSKIGGVGVRLG